MKRKLLFLPLLAIFMAVSQADAAPRKKGRPRPATQAETEEQNKIQAIINEKLTASIDLVIGLQPGKAALLMQEAMALEESMMRMADKSIIESGLAQTPIHTGQPSGGFSQDAMLAQMAFTTPGVMSDSLTAFQQEDNPRHYLPPDYRREIRKKEQTGQLAKELKLAGTIYASQEQLVETARELLGHLKLRVAADLSCANDAGLGGTGGGKTIRVDKRAIPFASMDPNAPLPPSGKKKLKKSEADTVKGLKYADIKDNERAGAQSPFQSQTPGGGSASKKDDEKDDEKDDLEGVPDKRAKSSIDWQVTMGPQNPTESSSGGGGDKKKPREKDKEPQLGAPSSAGGGGGGEQQQQQGEQQPQGEQQQQQAGTSSHQQLADQQNSLAAQAEAMAKGIAQRTEPGNDLGQKALDELRQAAREMKQAAESFQKGDLQNGIAQSSRAQQAIRSAMHGMQASQFGSLEQAVSAAQQGVTALSENQARVSQDTKQMAMRAQKLTGGPTQGQTGAQQQTGQRGGQKGQQGQSGQNGKQGKPSDGQGGTGEMPLPSQKTVEEAMAFDPDMAAKMQSLAGEQMDLAKDAKDFDMYVQDLVKWAATADNDRVADSLKDVSGGIKRENVPQKMIDAGVDLAQRNLKGAAAAQQDIENAIDKVSDQLREANAVLAGSPTAILSRAVRQAKEVSQEVRKMAGLGETQQGQNQAGQSQSGDQQQASQSSSASSQGEQNRPKHQSGETPDKTAKQPQSDSPSGKAGGEPGPGDNMMGGPLVQSKDDINELWMKAKELAGVLQREQLADQKTLAKIQQRISDPENFRSMFDQVRKAEAGKFSDVMEGVGKTLETVLEETLSAKRLHDEQREECPPKYRAFLSAYFETLSKVTTEKK